MKRVGSVMLALLAAILFPVLIWVGLFVAIRKPLLRGLKRAGAIALALLGGTSAPILIWVGLFVAMKEWVQEWGLRRMPARTIGEILTAAGLGTEWKASAETAPVMGCFLPLPVSKVNELLGRAGL